MPNLVSFEWLRFVDGFEVVELHTDDFEIDTSTLDFDIDDLVDFDMDFEGLEVSITSRASPAAAKVVEALLKFELLELQSWSSPEGATDSYLLAHSCVTESYRPLDQFTGLFMEFSETPPTPEGVLGFANKYGLVRRKPPILNKDIPFAVQIRKEFYFDIQRMHDTVSCWRSCEEAGDLNPLVEHWSDYSSQAQLMFIRVPGRPRPSLVLEPQSLIDGMFLQLALAISGNAQLKRCAVCPTWFAYGTATGRRKSAHYCSDRCRKAAHRHAKETRE